VVEICAQKNEGKKDSTEGEKKQQKRGEELGKISGVEVRNECAQNTRRRISHPGGLITKFEQGKKRLGEKGSRKTGKSHVEKKGRVNFTRSPWTVVSGREVDWRGEQGYLKKDVRKNGSGVDTRRSSSNRRTIGASNGKKARKKTRRQGGRGGTDDT